MNSSDWSLGMEPNLLALPRWRAATSAEWGDWRWQLRNAIRTVAELKESVSQWTDAQIQCEADVESVCCEAFGFKITPHMLAEIRNAIDNRMQGAWEAFQRSYIPSHAEMERIRKNGDGRDGIGEDLPVANPVPSVTHLYGNRVLLRLTGVCPAHCRYCFRRRVIGDASAWDQYSIDNGLAYIAKNPQVREVILSGGDPLVLSDERIERLLTAIKSIPHVRRVRIDTKVLSVVPQRITPRLASLLRAVSPTYVVAHFTHSYELSRATRAACSALADTGIPLAAHIPLLKGVNDSAEVLCELCESLVDLRVRPYYLIQFIPTRWTEHFRVPIERALDLVRALETRCSGLAVPKYIVYLPGAGGKVTLSPRYLQSRNSQGWVFENLQGRTITYPEPPAQSSDRP